jgi:hypothetical protein
MKNYEYTIDGLPYTWEDFIQEGKALGFESDDSGVTTTSEIASFLRRTGHKVDYYKEEIEPTTPTDKVERVI